MEGIPVMDVLALNFCKANNHIFTLKTKERMKQRVAHPMLAAVVNLVVLLYAIFLVLAEFFIPTLFCEDFVL